MSVLAASTPWTSFPMQLASDGTLTSKNWEEQLFKSIIFTNWKEKVSLDMIAWA